jgi:4-amino-4-deoxy-L-arabinose transferase-like glycosyltransferase
VLPLTAQRSWAWIRQHQDAVAVLLILIVAFLPRAAFMFRVPVFFVVGSRPYYATAIQWVTGLDVTALSLRHTPGYPMFLVGVIGLFGLDPLAIAAVQHVLGIVTAVLCYYVGKLTFGRLVGLGAGLLAALNTTSVVYEHHILTEPVFSFLLLSTLCLLVAAARWRLGWLFLLGGLAAGLAALTRPIGQTIVLAAPIALWLHFRAWRPTLRASALLVAGFALAAGPWAVRNMLTHSEASVRHPGSTLLGNIMHARPYTRGFFTLDGGVDPDPVRLEARRIIERMSPEEPDPLEMWTELQQRLGVTPGQANKLMGEIALDTIARHPWYYAGFFATKVGNLLALARDESLTEFLKRPREQWPGRFLSASVREGRIPDLRPSDMQPAHRWEIDRAVAVADFFRPARAAPLLAVLFLIGLGGALARPDRRLLLIPALVVLGIVVLNGVIAGDKPRYRYPLEPAIGLVAMAGAVTLAEAIVGLAQRALARYRTRQLSAQAG